MSASTVVGSVSIDGLPGSRVLAEYESALRWNGFLAAPRIDAWGVVSVLDALTDDAPDAAPVWETGPDGAFIVWHREAMDDPGYEPDVYPPDGDGLYALGAYGWVWSEVYTEESGR